MLSNALLQYATPSLSAATRSAFDVFVFSISFAGFASPMACEQNTHEVPNRFASDCYVLVCPIQRVLENDFVVVTGTGTRVILSGFSPSNCTEKTKRKPVCQTCQLRAS